MTPVDLDALREHYDTTDTSAELRNATLDASVIAEPMVGITIRISATTLDAARVIARRDGIKVTALLSEWVEQRVADGVDEERVVWVADLRRLIAHHAHHAHDQQAGAAIRLAPAEPEHPIPARHCSCRRRGTSVGLDGFPQRRHTMVRASPTSHALFVRGPTRDPAPVIECVEHLAELFTGHSPNRLGIVESLQPNLSGSSHCQGFPPHEADDQVARFTFVLVRRSAILPARFQSVRVVLVEDGHHAGDTSAVVTRARPHAASAVGTATNSVRDAAVVGRIRETQSRWESYAAMASFLGRPDR